MTSLVLNNRALSAIGFILFCSQGSSDIPQPKSPDPDIPEWDWGDPAQDKVSCLNLSGRQPFMEIHALFPGLGPVLQSIVRLTSLFRGQLIKCSMTL